jgi:uncharacterized protein YdaU (DUF1376 family)
MTKDAGSTLSWFPMYHGDYLRDTGDLSPAEHGVYLLLLMAFVSRGPLPDDLNRLCRTAAGAEPEDVRQILERYWERTDKGWINGKMARVIEIQHEKHQKRVEAGRKGGQIKSSNAKAMLQQCSTNQNQNQNQNQNHLKDTQSPSSTETQNSAAKKAPSVPFQKIADLWAEVLPELPQPVKLSEARKANIRARWQDELPDLDAWRECFTHIRQSRFLMGKVAPPSGRRQFRCTLDWIAKQENLIKLYEGRYDG